MRAINIVRFLLLLAFAATAAAQSGTAVSPNLYSDMKWRMIGPFRGGRALTAAGVRGNRNVYYFGAVGGGVWKTTNAGETWSPILDAQPIASIGSLAVAPSDANVIYVGTGEASIRSDISFGNGMYKSTDAGKTWQHIGLEDTRHIGRVLVHPTDPNIVYVAALGHAYGPNAERGVFKTTDGGRTWNKVLFKDENTGAIDLAFDPDDARTIYATLWNAHRPPWSTYAPIQGPGSGIYKSTDGGDHWTQLTNGLPKSDLGRIGLATCKNVVYAVVDAQNNTDTGLYRSDDRGETWKRVSTDRRISGRGWYFGEITTDPKNPDIVYSSNVSLYKSVNGGKTFVALKGAPGGDDYHFLWIDPDDGQRMIDASDQGTVISVDGGVSWTSWYNQPTAQMYHVTTDNQFPTYYVYGAQQDSGTVATASRSDYGSITFRDWYSVGAGESGYIVPDPHDANTVYGGDTYGRLYRFDKKTGESQDISPTAGSSFGEEMGRRKLRFTWTTPIVFSADGKSIYMGAQYVLRSSDRGHSWEKISPDLTGCAADTSRPAIDATKLTRENSVAGCWGVVYTIAPSAQDAKVIWAGTDTGRVYVSRDGGTTWTNVTPPKLGDWSKISMIEASPHDAATAYAAVDRHRLDDYAPHAYVTHDFGKTWAEKVKGIAAPAFVRAVREDPKRKGLLYAGTETGAYVSFDDGGHWSSLKLNMPVTPIHDLVVHNDDLVVATHGRSFWILDDLEPLRQIADTTTPSLATQLFVPATAYRLRSDEQHDTPLPPETPMGQNPPSGAILDYYLAQPAQNVSLIIRDASGREIRTYSSHDQEPPRQTVAFPDYWFVPAQKLATTAGHHRFVWDMRYADPPAQTRSYELSATYGVGAGYSPRGPLALPGQYTVTLRINDTAAGAGKMLPQPLTLAPDPRLKVTLAELQQQLELEMQIVAAMQQAWDAMKAQGQTQTPANQPLGRPRGDTFGSVHAGLAALLDVVDSADAAPTQQAQEAWRELKAKLDKLLAR